MKEMSQNDDVNAMTSRRSQRKAPNTSKPQGTGQGKRSPTSQPTLAKCKFCSKSHPRKRELCPAWQKVCKECGQSNHFAGSSACKGDSKSQQNKRRTVHGVNDDSDEENDYFCYVESVDSVSDSMLKRKIFATMHLKDQKVKFQLDCGATVNVIPVDIYSDIFDDHALALLMKTDTKLRMFNKSELTPLGSIDVKTLNPKNRDSHTLRYLVVTQGHKPILGAQAIQQFNLMTINIDNISSVTTETPAQSDLLTEFKDVFSGDGKLEEQLHLEVDKSVTPVALPVRKTPIALREPLKKELERLTAKGILQPVEVPTDWVSSMVVATKRNGKIRLCIDPKPLNKALKRNRYPLPVIDDLLPSLTNARLFSVLDAKNGFWHVQLDEESSYLTTFGTPWGRYRWTRMPFGISVAPEEFQRRLDNALAGLDGVQPIFDDILLYGVGETDVEAQLDHDTKLRALLQRCREKGVKLNRDKLKLRRTEVTFMGHTVTKDGLKPDPSKLQGIREMPAPQNKQDVKRFLGMVNYLQRFASNLSNATAPLRDLLKEANQFCWDAPQVESFTKVKNIISEAPVLKFFNSKESVEIQCDASERGLGACLMQNGQPIAYASRSMTDTEINYAQIEKEMLAIVFAVERFEQYVYGRPILVQSDHKPLESIYKKSLMSAPKRLQRMLLRLQRFDLTITYKKGSEMVLADTLSRAYGTNQDTGETERDVEAVHMIQFLPVSEESQAIIQKATESDESLRDLKSVIRKGWPLTKDEVPVNIRAYFPFRDELTMQNGLIFKGERLVIPKSVTSDMLEKIHASHIGIQGCLRRAREVLYWPGMNKDIEEFVSRCETCNSYRSDQAKEPLICHELPTRPWEKVAIDIFELDQREFLVTVDYYSSFFEVDRLLTKTAREVINKIKPHFARHGIPDTVMSDNGQPFASSDFQHFSDLYGFEHVTSSPGYAQSNGKVENAVNTAKSLMKKATESKKDPYLALLDWRNTPSEHLNSSPAQRIFGRRTKTLLPTSANLLKPHVPEVQQRLKQQKAKQSYYYNRGAKELPELQPGDTVRIKPLKLGKRDWTPAQVESKVDIRSYQVRTEDGRTFRRNRRHLRKTKESLASPLQTEPTITPEPANQSITSPAVQPTKPAETAQPPTKTDTAVPPSPHVTPPGVTTTRSGRISRPPDRFQ